jgi:hypothetical protein
MHSDLYTKAVLTVIAGALVALLMQNAIGTSNAQQQVSKMQICNVDGSICAGVGNRTLNGQTISGLATFDFVAR